MSPIAPPDPILDERRKLGPIEVHTITASSVPEAHAALGTLQRAPASTMIARRLADTPPPEREAGLRTAVASHAFLRARAAGAAVPAAVRRAIGEYLDSLAAWSAAAGLDAVVDDRAAVGGKRVTPEELALWAQDDNTGCQTGMVRRADGAVMIWHTEEDTIGYFDRPRLVSFAIRGETLAAFLYPYLLPGPAFGFRTGQIHAVDSLHVRRERTPEGAFTSTVSWLVWRLGQEVDARTVGQALAPCVDGAAINVVQPGGGSVHAATHELGGRHVASRTLPARPGARGLQVNMIHRADSPLGREEALTRRERVKYANRLARTHAFLDTRAGRDPGPDAVVRMLAGRRGGSYAFANTDVKAYAVAIATPQGFELFAQSGAAHPSDAYQPQWRLP